MPRKLLLAVLGFVCWWQILPLAQAQIVVNLSAPGPTFPRNVNEADEYFSQVLRNPKQNGMDNCDVSDRFRYKPKGTVNGVWQGTHPDSDQPVFGILDIPTTGTNLAVYREDCNQLGIQTGRQIDAARFTRAAWVMGNTSPSSFSFLFSKDTNYAINGFADFDGHFPPAGAGISTAPARRVGWDFSLTARAAASYPWSGFVTGISLWPTFTQPAGGTTALDWFRIYDPSTEGSLSLSWSPTVGQMTNDYVRIFVDKDNSGYDGMAFNTGSLPRSGSTSFGLGKLAPGSYYFYVELASALTSPPTFRGYSNYVGPVVINAKPRLVFSSPNRMSGPEYSRDELGDPWDMNSLTDVVNLYDPNGNVLDPVFHGMQAWRIDNVNGNNYFVGTSKGAPVGQVDTQVHMRVASNKPIDANFYRYFCLRMQVDPANLPSNGDVNQLNLAGWVERFIWVNIGNVLGSTAAHEIVERSTAWPDYENGSVTYCFDLWDESGYESGIRYRNARYIKTARFDPVEASPATNFAIDWAGMFAENVDTQSHQYQISWKLDDDANNSTVSLYYDTDNSGYNGVLITTLNNQNPGTGSYAWDTSGIPNGTYYIYAVVTDGGGNVSKFYSEVYVQVGGTIARPALHRTACDYDGDGKSDPTVIRSGSSSTGTIYTLQTANGVTVSRDSGNTGRDVYPEMDSDGDLAADYSLAYGTLRSPGITWYSTQSSDLQTSIVGWGTTSDIPLTIDADGDGKSDRAVYRPGDSTWWILYSGGGSLGTGWGAAGDIPVPADYDGDGKDDIAVFRPADGSWYVILSGGGLLVRQFGVSGDDPMPGDYDGDGKADLGLFRQDGNWFRCLSTKNFDCTQAATTQFGLAGDTPVRVDADGDGKLDLGVFRSGTWLVLLSSSGLIDIKQLGASGDYPVCSGPKHLIALVAQGGQGSGGGGSLSLSLSSAYVKMKLKNGVYKGTLVVYVTSTFKKGTRLILVGNGTGVYGQKSFKTKKPGQTVKVKLKLTSTGLGVFDIALSAGGVQSTVSVQLGL